MNNIYNPNITSISEWMEYNNFCLLNLQKSLKKSLI